ncbi:MULTISPECIES: hypothetical protein [unclassified Butyrivibrio]|uniref:hypothetical protein n=1 Tax=unclassified Butyrivibrio TaxID=2639466 RepID=UPI00041A1CF3|nr:MULTISPECIES: hypothetical protein [unclassified Butyrivibrio]
MKPKSKMSRMLYEMLLNEGYEERFCDLITQNLNTDFTATRMIGYLSHYSHPPQGEIVDEMLSILSDRNRIIEKKTAEGYNAKWNQMMQEGLFDGDE